MSIESSMLNRSSVLSGSSSSLFFACNRQIQISTRISPQIFSFPSRISTNCIVPYIHRGFFNSRLRESEVFDAPSHLRSVVVRGSGSDKVEDCTDRVNLWFVEVLVKRGFVLAAMICGILALGCRRVLAAEGVLDAGYGVFEQSVLALRSSWPKVLLVLRLFKEQGLVLAALLGLSAFFSMAETSITTLWPWK
ncbi:unnamed protein product, partial [Ilex paraguariensis]